TIAVVDAVKKAIPDILRNAAEGMRLKLDFDQSEFVRAAVKSVLEEAVIAAVLVSIMILLFLGSWRSVIIVCTSIPLSILAAIIAMLASYLLSRTLVPVLSRLLLRNTPEPHTWIGRWGQAYNEKRERTLDGLRDRYGSVLEVLLHHRRATLGLAGVIFAISL